MAGTASPGVTLSPNRNVTAPAGVGGDLWGANGGGIAPMGGSKPIAATLSDGETANNYQPPASPPQPLGCNESNASLSAQTLDSSIGSGGANQG